MRILHYMPGIPPVRGGGLIRYALDLLRCEQAAGEEAVLLVPGIIPRNIERPVNIYAMQKYGAVPVFAVYNPLPVPMGNGILDIDRYTKPCDQNVYIRFLLKVRPDVIHIHSFMGLHREFLWAADHCKIPAIFSSHDYFGICPAVTMMCSDHICTDKDWKYCELCCRNAYTERKLRLEQSRMYRQYRKNRRLVQFVHHEVFRKIFRPWMAPEIADAGKERLTGCEKCRDYQKLKKYYEEMFRLISFFPFNSSLARQIYVSRLGNVPGDIIQISHCGIHDHRKKRSYGSVLKIGYLGSQSKYKGFPVLLKACSRLYEEGCRKIELHVYTGQRNEDVPFIKTHPPFPPRQIAAVMDNIDLLIMPSIGPETFGFAALEAVSCGVPVVLSKNVGMKDILSKDPGIGFIYDGTAEGLKMLLKKIYQDRSLLAEANENILKMHCDFSYKDHLKNMLEMKYKRKDMYKHQ